MLMKLNKHAVNLMAVSLCASALLSGTGYLTANADSNTAANNNTSETTVQNKKVGQISYVDAKGSVLGQGSIYQNGNRFSCDNIPKGYKLAANVDLSKKPAKAELVPDKTPAKPNTNNAAAQPKNPKTSNPKAINFTAPKGYEIKVAPRTVTRIINYVDNSGKTLAPAKVQTHTYAVLTKKGDKTGAEYLADIVNGKAVSIHRQSLGVAAVKSPILKGYHLVNKGYRIVRAQSIQPNHPNAKKSVVSPYLPLEGTETINVVYQKNHSLNAVPVNGYSVVSVGTLSRTVNFVDAKGKKLAPSKFESVKREILKQNTTAPAAKPKAQQKKTASNVAKKPNTANNANAKQTAAKKAANATNKNQNQKKNTNTKGTKAVSPVAIIQGNKATVVDPRHPLTEVKAPQIKGYHLKNAKLGDIKGQQFWLANKDALTSNPKLANGLPTFITGHATVNVIYVKNGAKAGATTGSQNSSNNGTGSQAATNNNGGSNGSGQSDSGVLPRTDNGKNSLLGIFLASSLGAIATFIAKYLSFGKKKRI